MIGINWKSIVPLSLAASGLLLWYGRVRGEHAVEQRWVDLASTTSDEPAVFDEAMVQDLPAPAQRYLLRAIRPGTPLATSVTFRMTGSMRLQPGSDLLPMQANQILAPPHGFVWRARVGAGLLRFRGFDRFGDGQGELRWWLHGLLPVVNASGDDVRRSAAGRLAGEAILVPSTLLPRNGVRWEARDDSTAVFEMNVGDEPVRVTIVVDAEGRLENVRIRRWRDDAGEGAPGFDHFDVDQFVDERTISGYTVPTSFRAGWRLNEADGFPFFFASISELTYR